MTFPYFLVYLTQMDKRKSAFDASKQYQPSRPNEHLIGKIAISSKATGYFEVPSENQTQRLMTSKLKVQI